MFFNCYFFLYFKNMEFVNNIKVKFIFDKKKNKKISLKFLFIIFLIIISYKILNIRYFIWKFKIKKIRIGILGVLNDQNAGNNLVKFSMFTLLKQYGLDPIIISKTREGNSRDFLDKTVKLIEINKTYSELNEKDYDILMVNSDQTWSPNQLEFLYDYGFLRFSENWTIPKFIYAASMGSDHWLYSKEFDKKAMSLLKKFNGISVREKALVKLTYIHLGIKPLLVLDPTFLINKKYYLDIIKNYKRNFNFKEKYLYVYQLDENFIINEFIEEAKKKLKYKIFKSNQFEKFSVENFLFGINISQAIITDSFHGTVFSIIFNKPFITFINSIRGSSRFFSLNETFNLKNRIVYPVKDQKPEVKLLSKPLKINQNSLNRFKKISINFLKKNIFL